MSSDRKRLVMWRRLMLMHAARRSLSPVHDRDATRSEREVREPVAEREASRTQ